MSASVDHQVQDEDKCTDIDGFLYMLDLDCPFPFPEKPNYPIDVAPVAGPSRGREAFNDNHMALMNGEESSEYRTNNAAVAHQASASSGSRACLPDASILDDQHPSSMSMQVEGSNTLATAAEESSAATTSTSESLSLKEHYWDCLYCSEARSQQIDASRRFLGAFKAKRFRNNVFSEEAGHVNSADTSYKAQLTTLLIPKLNRFDAKWHTELPAVLDTWLQEFSDLQERDQGTVDTDQENFETRDDLDFKRRQQNNERAMLVHEAAEIARLEQVYKSWIRVSQEGMKAGAPAKDASHRLRSSIRDKLSSLETVELQLQILLSLELLSVLPVPSYLSARSAHHRHRHSGSISHPQNWLAVLRQGTPKRSTSSTTAGVEGRKRKKAGANATVEETTAKRSTDSILSTPRHSLHRGSLLASNIETIAEDENDEAAMERERLEKLFRDTARLLDTQTDNLAIQQTVANAIGGLSLADLLGDTGFGNGGDTGKGKGKEEAEAELDMFQSFWLEVVEEHYSDLLPSDILSGCHSKFFSNSLDPNADHFGSTSHSLTHPSPFHHPTPNLRQLAQSVHMANLQAEKNAIPRSPTLLKLLAAKDINTIAEGGEEEEERDDVGWLMPAPAPGLGRQDPYTNGLRRTSAEPLTKSKPSATVGVQVDQGQAPGRQLKRSMSSNSSSLANLHRTRTVEIGKAKSMQEKHAEVAARKFKVTNGQKPFTSTVTSVMASSLGARGYAAEGVIVGGSLASVPVGTVAGLSSDKVSAAPTLSKAAVGTSTAMLSSSVPLQQITGQVNNKNAEDGANTTAARISKRKAASPKKRTDVDKSRGKTLVLATPAKIRSATSASTAAAAAGKMGGPAQQARVPSWLKQRQSSVTGDSASASTSMQIAAPRLSSAWPNRSNNSNGSRTLPQGNAKSTATLAEPSSDAEDEEWDDVPQHPPPPPPSARISTVLVGETPQK